MTHLELTGRRATGSGNTSGRLSPVNLLFIGVSPLIGRAILIYLFVKSLIEWSDPANSYSGESWLGWAPPSIIGVGFLLLGVVLSLPGENTSASTSSNAAVKSRILRCSSRPICTRRQNCSRFSLLVSARTPSSSGPARQIVRREG